MRGKEWCQEKETVIGISSVSRQQEVTLDSIFACAFPPFPPSQSTFLKLLLLIFILYQTHHSSHRINKYLLKNWINEINGSHLQPFLRKLMSPSNGFQLILSIHVTADNFWRSLLFLICGGNLKATWFFHHPPGLSQHSLRITIISGCAWLILS